MQSIVLLK
ncbi:unnamed protein product, partial [Didymodactylos carnosus]